MTVRLNDIWRNLSKEINFYTKETFESIPPVAGVYAWFYPLRILTHDMFEFIKEIELVLNYDSQVKGQPHREYNDIINWQKINHTISYLPVDLDATKLNEFKKNWDDFTANQKKFDLLRKIIMRSSILLPPLYVGKTIDLSSRCFQHINGSGSDNDFHNRFEEFASKHNLIKAKKVSDLLFITLKTGSEDSDEESCEKLVEAILKQLAKPKYSKI